RPSDIQTDMIRPLGVNNAPIVIFSSPSLVFGSQAVGTTSAASVVTLTNVGGGTLNINNIAVTGPHSSDFAQTNNCPSSVATNAGCTISVTFTPSIAAARTASLAVT